MIHSVRFTCVLDTNVIYPIFIRDLLFWFASYELCTIKWSLHIFDEWERLMKTKGFDSGQIERAINGANSAFPDAFVSNYEALIDTLNLKDEQDNHVLAAAIKTNANIIVTNNLKDFPDEYLNTFGLKAKGADDFISDLIDLNPETAVEAFMEMVFAKKNPDLDEYEVLDIMRKNGLVDSANYLHALI